MLAKKHNIEKTIKQRAARLTFAAMLFIAPTFAFASPWIDVGDERSRHHLNYLKDTGAINLPLSSWPVNWSDVSRELSDIDLDGLSTKQLWSYRYLRHAKKRASRTLKTTKRFYGSNSLIPFTHFASESRDQAYAASETTYINDSFALNIAAQAVRNPTDEDKYRYDGSYIATKLGNWILGAGSIERWWGPGWQSSLILSNNARPAPGYFIRRNESLGSHMPLLSLLGPWTFEAFVNTLEEERAISKAKLIGARFTFMPLSFLEVGYSRMTLSGGKSSNLTTSDDDPSFTNASASREERNQNISYDVRISVPVNWASLAIYGQTMSNETANDVESESATMAGIEAGFSWGAIHNRIALEYSDTENASGDNTISTNAVYDHPYYLSGYRYYGRTVGESAGTNALKLSLLGDHYFENGHQFSWRLSTAELNKSSASNNLYTDSALEQDLVELSYKLPLNTITRVNAGVFYLNEDMAFAGKKINSGAYLMLELRF